MLVEGYVDLQSFHLELPNSCFNLFCSFCTSAVVSLRKVLMSVQTRSKVKYWLQIMEFMARKISKIGREVVIPKKEGVWEYNM